MRRILQKLFRLAGWCLLAATGPWTLPACNVPVFRYALERWEADAYQAVVFHDKPFSSQHQDLLTKLETGSGKTAANLTVNQANVAQGLSQTLQALWNLQANPTLPWMVIKYPKQTRVEIPVWAGPFTVENVESVLESPARSDIARKLLSGDAVVWLLLESDDKKRDEDTEQLVQSELRKLEKTLSLPERSAQDPPINPDLPLKIAFSTLRMARSDPAERMLVNMLLSWNTNLVSRREPMLFPVFGRGRVIPPAIGEEIRPEAIRDMAGFLTGACSCEIKAMNPGYDLLLAANWNLLPAYEETLVPSPPPLVGMSQFAATAATNVPEAAPRPAATAPAKRDPLFRNLAVVFGVGLLGLCAATLLLRVRNPRKPS